MTKIVLSNSTPLQIDICVCTFRRPHIARTLQSLASLELQPNWTIRIIVADNDDAPSAQKLVDATSREYKLPVTYIHAPARNISIARNACLDAAQSPLLAFVDDDEVVTPDWLNALVIELEKSQADVILGKVHAVYDPQYPNWMRAGDFHAPNPVWVKGTIRTGYSCNVLFQRLAPSINGLRFREEFGQSGGEDTIFFTEVFRSGGRFSYAPNAIVTEDVAPVRATFSWLFRRSFRSGQTHGVLILEDKSANFLTRVKALIITFAKIVFCTCGAFLNAGRSVRFRYWILRAAMHVGTASRLLGKRELAIYK